MNTKDEIVENWLPRYTGTELDEFGQYILLTNFKNYVDLFAQRFAYARMGEETGAVVTMDVETGDLLTLTSNPGFDPNLFAEGISSKDWRALISDPLSPLSNKAVVGQYAPGSTFKMLVALAALEHGVVTPKNGFFCNGEHKLGRGRFHCWRRGGHGWMTMGQAIEESCDIYFYEIARKVGIDRIAEMGRRFGLGDRTGVDLPAEKKGVMPTRAWKKRAIGESWQLGETLIAGIGQGFVLTTPLQLAVMTARLANGGRPVTPRLTRVAAAPAPPPDVAPLAAPENLAVIQEAMVAVTSGKRGTARGSQIDIEGFHMAGKTGTSQVRRIGREERLTGVRKNEELPRKFRDHSLFVGYAPLDRPRYACAVMVEHGGSGSKVAAPIARDVLLEAQRRRSAEWRPDATPSSDRDQASLGPRGRG